MGIRIYVVIKIDSIINIKYRSRALKSHSKLRAALEKILLHENISLFSVTFGEKVPALGKSRGS